MKISEFLVENDWDGITFSDKAPMWFVNVVKGLHKGSLLSDHIFNLVDTFAIDYDNGKITEDDSEDGFNDWANDQVNLVDSNVYQFAADNCDAKWYDEESASDLLVGSSHPLEHIRAVQYFVAQSVAYALWVAIGQSKGSESASSGASGSGGSG